MALKYHINLHLWGQPSLKVQLGFVFLNPPTNSPCPQQVCGPSPQPQKTQRRGAGPFPEAAGPSAGGSPKSGGSADH